MEYTELFQWFHRHPEVGFHETQTTQRIRRELEDSGIEILDSGLETGLIAVIRGSKEGKAICLRADIDALPVTEQTGLPYASEHTGVMHACGHDFHIVTALGAAKLLQSKAQKEPLAGTVYFAFEPAEEQLGGALSLLKTGLLNDISEFYAIHCDPGMEVGRVGINVGGVMSAFDQFRIDVHGVGTHAATPHLGKNPIPVLVSLIQSLQTFASDMLSNASRRVISFTQLGGGTTWNVIPETAYCVGTVRTLDETDRARIREAFVRITREYSVMTGAECALTWNQGSPCVCNDQALCDAAWEVALRVGLTPVHFLPELLSDDFSYLSGLSKGAYLKVGTGVGHALHHPGFQADLSALEPTAVYLAELLASRLR